MNYNRSKFLHNLNKTKRIKSFNRNTEQKMKKESTMLIYDSRDNYKKNDTQIRIELKKINEILRELTQEIRNREDWLFDNPDCTSYL
jgi:hypothetical protein